MSIKVGNTNYKTTNNIDERLTLQSKTNTTLLELRPSIMLTLMMFIFN